MFLLICLLVAAAVCAPEHFRVKSLPEMKFTPSYKMYAGYLDGGNGNMLFFFFAEASDKDPHNAPIVGWQQGGPGCASMMGNLAENGPLHLDDKGKIVENPWRWNRHANMLYIDMPSWVGYSYNTQGQMSFGDNDTFTMTAQAYTSFFKLFPEYAGNTFYLSGESYAGHYLPGISYFMHYVLDSPQKPTAFFLGNPWIDDVIDGNAVFPWIWSHTLCSLETWLEVSNACNITFDDLSSALPRPASLFDSRRPLHHQMKSNDYSCNDAMNQMTAEVGDGLSQYDIYWPCHKTAGSVLGCIDMNVQTDYLNRDDVRKALHSKAGLPAWSVCSSVLNYTSSWPSMVPAIQRLMQDMQVVIVSGDVTFNCGTLGTEAWIASMGLQVKSAWTNWLYPAEFQPQVGGYVKMWENITLATVREAGHMIPQFQPERSYMIFEEFLKGKLNPMSK